MNWFTIGLVSLAVLIALMVAVVATSLLFGDQLIAREARKIEAYYRYPDIVRSRTAILIACYKGEGTIGTTVRYALNTGCSVYVVIDGPGDDSATVARRAGARVLALTSNGGKPAALWSGYQYFQLSRRYDAVAILDDDVMIEKSFIRRSLELFTPETAIVVGKNITWWPGERRWNMLLASRAYSYWNYQLIVRRIQSWFGVMNCISGSNSVYRTEVLDEVLRHQVRYIVDDTQWLLDVVRKKLGKVVYAPRARAHLQDPTNFGDWYKQNLRWLKGTVQGIIGHQVGRHMTWFDYSYIVLIFHWVLYVFSAPVTIYLIWVGWQRSPTIVILAFAGYYLWIAIGAIALRRFELVLLAPAIIAIDFIYRWLFIKATIDAIREPTVQVCRWDSPARMTMK